MTSSTHTQVPDSTSVRQKTSALPWFRGESVGQRIFRTRAMDFLPRVITHERIYILPSRRGWAFLFSLLVMLIASINYNLSLGYALSFMLTGLFTSALIATYRNLAGLELINIQGTEATLGEDLNFHILLKNRLRKIRFGIDVGNDEVTTRSDIEASGSCTVKLPLPTLSRGLQPVGRLTVKSDYPLGLWFTWSYIHVECTGLVFARPETEPPPLPVVNHEGADEQPARSVSMANQGDVVSVRAYQPGDSMGSIAWKTAARGLGLHTREFATETRSTDLILHWDATLGLKDTEQRISRLAAWIKIAEEQDRAFSLVLPSQSHPMGHGIEHVLEAKRLLALYEH